MSRIRRKIDSIKIRDGRVSDIIINALANSGYDVDFDNDVCNCKNNIALDIYMVEEKTVKEENISNYY